MFKVLSLLAVFIGTSYIGVEMGRRYIKREKLFNELIMFCNVLSNNIKFNRNKLKYIISENIENYSYDLREYLSNFLEDRIDEIYFLSRYENQKLSEFMRGLGNFDSNGEIGYIENYKILFEEFHKKSCSENKKYGALYSKLGIMLGLILVILFI